MPLTDPDDSASLVLVLVVVFRRVFVTMASQLPASRLLVVFVTLSSWPELRDINHVTRPRHRVCLMEGERGLLASNISKSTNVARQAEGQRSSLVTFREGSPGLAKRASFVINAEISTTPDAKDLAVTDVSDSASLADDTESASRHSTDYPDLQSSTEFVDDRLKDYTQTVLVIGITVAFALTLAVGGSIAAGICRSDGKRTVNPVADPEGSDLDKQYVAHLRRIAMEIPTPAAKYPTYRGGNLFVHETHENSKTLLPLHHHNHHHHHHHGHVTSSKQDYHVTTPKRHGKRQKKEDRRTELILGLSNGDCPMTARDIVVEDI